MTITIDEVRRIARLAQLELPRRRDASGAWVEPESPLLDEAALTQLAGDLGRVLDYVRDLERLDVSGVEPTSHGYELAAAIRVDETKPHLTAGDLLQQAPDRDSDAVAVPRILEPS